MPSEAHVPQQHPAKKPKAGRPSVKQPPQRVTQICRRQKSSCCCQSAGHRWGSSGGPAGLHHTADDGRGEQVKMVRRDAGLKCKDDCSDDERKACGGKEKVFSKGPRGVSASMSCSCVIDDRQHATGTQPLSNDFRYKNEQLFSKLYLNKSE